MISRHTQVSLLCQRVCVCRYEQDVSPSRAGLRPVGGFPGLPRAGVGVGSGAGGFETVTGSNVLRAKLSIAVERFAVWFETNGPASSSSRFRNLHSLRTHTIHFESSDMYGAHVVISASFLSSPRQLGVQPMHRGDRPAQPLMVSGANSGLDGGVGAKRIPF